MIMLENSLPYDTSVDAPSMPLDAQLPTMESNEIQSLQALHDYWSVGLPSTGGHTSLHDPSQVI